MLLITPPKVPCQLACREARPSGDHAHAHRGASDWIRMQRLVATKCDRVPDLPARWRALPSNRLYGRRPVGGLPATAEPRRRALSALPDEYVCKGNCAAAPRTTIGLRSRQPLGAVRKTRGPVVTRVPQTT